LKKLKDKIKEIGVRYPKVIKIKKKELNNK